jgi:hypothetical protein
MIMSEYLYRLSADENQSFQNLGLRFYLKSIVDGQRGKLIGGTQPGSWCLGPDDLMDSDARVDFIFKPTYLAVATLSLAKINRFWYLQPNFLPIPTMNCCFAHC